MITQGDRYIGGGILEFKKSGETTWVEIGEIQEAKINMSVTFADAFSKDRVQKKLVEKVAKEINSTTSFSTQKVNVHNLAMFLLGTESTENYSIGDELPDGSIATEATTAVKIKAGDNPVIEGSLRFIGDEDGAKKPVILIHQAVITPSGDLPMIVDEFANLSYEGAILETDDGFYDEYLMDVGA